MFRILVVDDDPDHRRAIEDALHGQYDVTSAESGVAALALDPGAFDLVITDLRMPGMSGIELRRHLRERGVAVPMILISSDADMGSEALSEGFSDFLGKPISLDRLEAVVAGLASEKAELAVVLEQPEVARELTRTAPATDTPLADGSGGTEDDAEEA